MPHIDDGPTSKDLVNPETERRKRGRQIDRGKKEPHLKLSCKTIASTTSVVFGNALTKSGDSCPVHYANHRWQCKDTRTTTSRKQEGFSGPGLVEGAKPTSTLHFDDFLTALAMATSRAPPPRMQITLICFLESVFCSLKGPRQGVESKQRNRFAPGALFCKFCDNSDKTFCSIRLRLKW